MEFPFANQRPLIKLWAILATLFLGILVVLSGGSLMLAERMELSFPEFDSRNYLITARFGLGTVLAVWLLHIAVLIALLGYDESPRRFAFAAICFCLCAGFLVFILVGVGIPFQFNGMSVM